MSIETRSATLARPAGVVRWLVAGISAALAVIGANVLAELVGRNHWWAGFILVPGALIAVAGGPLLARRGGLAFAGYLVIWVGVLVFTVGTLLMLGLMGAGWPVMVMLPCLAVAGSYRWRPEHPLPRAFHRTVAWLALAGVAVGATLQLIRLDVLDFGQTRWWGGFMMLAGVIVLGNGLELLRHRIAYRLQAVTLAAGPALVTFLIGLRHLRGDWPY